MLRYLHRVCFDKDNCIQIKNESDYEDDNSDDEEYLDKCTYCKIVLRSYEETDDHQSKYVTHVKCVFTTSSSGINMRIVTNSSYSNLCI